ncbi:MAG: hypothetical protein R3185_01995, partial [Candidatus Thermoplasmatota archaeon]|nr:hypothetical protein [Candidatus Thermoplasmatota archaeon]
DEDDYATVGDVRLTGPLAFEREEGTSGRQPGEGRDDADVSPPLTPEEPGSGGPSVGADPVARDDAQGARDAAEEANRTARDAAQAAREAKASADDARDTAKEATGKVEDLARQLEEDQDDAPIGLTLPLLALLVATLAARRRGT